MASSSHRLTAILDLKDKLSAKLKGATKQTDTFRDSQGRLRNALGQYTREADKATRAHDKFTRNGISGNNQMRSSSLGLVTALAGIVTTIMSAVSGARLLKNALNEAMKFEMAEATITAMFRGDTKGANDYIEMISAKALGSPLFNESDYFQNSKTFLTASKDLGELDDMWDIAERLAAMDPFQGLDGAAFAMRELFSGDALSMQKRFEMPKKFLNSIKNLPIADQLKALDKELTTMGFGKDFLASISDTGLAYKNQIEETFQKGLREIGMHGLEALKPHMKEFLEMLDTPAFEKLKTDIGETFGKALGKATQAVMYIVKNWSKISPIIETIGVAIATAFAATKIAGLIGFVTAAGGIGAVIASIFSPVLLIVGAVALLYYAFKTNLFGIRDIMTDVFSKVKEVTKNVMDFMAPYVSKGWEDTKKAFEVGKTIFSGFIDYMKGDYAKAWDGISDSIGIVKTEKLFRVFEKIETTIRPYIDKLKELAKDASVVFGSIFSFLSGDMSGSFKSLTEHFGMESGSDIFESFIGIKDTVQNALAGVSEIFQKVSETVISIIQQYWPVAQQIIQKVMDNIVPFLQSGWAIISGIFMTVVPIIVDIVKIAWEYISQIIAFVMPYILTVISTVWNTVIDVFMTVWNYIAEIMPMIQSIITVVWTILVPIIKGALDVIWGTIKIAFDLIWSIVSWVMKTIGGIIEAAWIFISGIFKTALQLLTGDFSGAWETLKETVIKGIGKIGETIWEWIKGAFDIGKKFVQGIIDGFLNLWDAVVKTAQGIWDAVSGIFKKKQTIGVEVEEPKTGHWGTNYNSDPYGLNKRKGGSHSGGLDYVPYDGYPAILHKGERVLTNEENNARGGGKGGGVSLTIAKLADQIIVRQESDIDKIADRIADIILEAGGNGA